MNPSSLSSLPVLPILSPPPGLQNARGPRTRLDSQAFLRTQSEPSVSSARRQAYAPGMPQVPDRAATGRAESASFAAPPGPAEAFVGQLGLLVDRLTNPGRTTGSAADARRLQELHASAHALAFDKDQMLTVAALLVHLLTHMHRLAADMPELRLAAVDFLHQTVRGLRLPERSALDSFSLSECSGMSDGDDSVFLTDLEDDVFLPADGDAGPAAAGDGAVRRSSDPLITWF